MYLGMEVHIYNPAPRRLKQDNFGLEASLGYIARSFSSLRKDNNKSKVQKASLGYIARSYPHPRTMKIKIIARPNDIYV